MKYPIIRNVLVKLTGVNKGLKNNRKIFILLKSLFRGLDYRILDHKSHIFQNGSMTAIVLLAESHGSIHTWTDKKFIVFEMVTSKKFTLKEKNYIMKKLSGFFEPTKMIIKVI